MLRARGLVECFCAGLQSAGQSSACRPLQVSAAASVHWPTSSRRRRADLAREKGPSPVNVQRWAPALVLGPGHRGPAPPAGAGTAYLGPGASPVDPVQRAAASVDPSALRACLTREGASFRRPPSRPQRGDPGVFGDWRKRSHLNPAGGCAVYFLVPPWRRKGLGVSGASLATVSAGFSVRER